jgi:hypothetical protein
VPSLLLLCLLAVDRQLTPEVAAGVGIGGAGYTFAGGRWGDTLAMPYALGRGMLGPVVAEVELLVAQPLGADGATTSLGVIPRLGFSGESWSVLVGASLQVAPSSVTVLQTLPSLRVRKNFSDAFGLSLGLFDLHGLAPLHLSAELGAFDVGFIAPLGLSAGARFALPWAGWKLQARALAFRLFSSELAVFTLGVAWGGES